MSDSLDELFGVFAPPGEATGHKNPFKFLDPYGPGDREIYFGRDLEIAELYSRFYKSRLLVVYGESGSGKTLPYPVRSEERGPPRGCPVYHHSQRHRSGKRPG